MRTLRLLPMLCLFVLAACSAPAADPTPAPVVPTVVPATAVPEPTVAAPTQEPTNTPTPIPEPTSTPTPIPEVALKTVTNTNQSVSVMLPDTWFTEADADFIAASPNENVYDSESAPRVLITSGGIDQIQILYELSDPSADALHFALLASMLTDDDTRNDPESITFNGYDALQSKLMFGSGKTAELITFEGQAQLVSVYVEQPASGIQAADTIANILASLELSEPQAQAETESDATTDWVTLADAGETFSLSAPAQWINLSMDGSNVNAVLQEFDPTINVGSILSGDMLRGLAISGVKFFAVDTTTENNVSAIPPSLNVTVLSTNADVALETLLETTRSQLEGIIPPNTDIQAEIVEIGGDPVAKLVYEMNLIDLQGAQNNRYIESYLWQVEGKSYNLALNVPSEVKDAYETDFPQIVESFVVEGQ